MLESAQGQDKFGKFDRETYFSPSFDTLPSERELTRDTSSPGVLAPPIDCEELPLEGNTVEYVYSD